MGDPQAYDDPVSVPPPPPPPPGAGAGGSPGGGSTGTSRRSGASGGSSGGLTSATRALNLYFRQLGIPGWQGLSRWATGLLRAGHGTDEIMALLYDRPEVKALGIVGSGGKILMDLNEYGRYATTARNLAAQFGIPNLTQKDIAKAIQNEASPEELQQRFRAYQVLHTNPGVIPALNAQIDAINADLKKRGLPPIPTVRTAADALNFVMGNSDVRIYNTYEAATISAAAKGAGFDISVAEAQGLARTTAGVVDMNDLVNKFATIKQQVAEAGVELEGFGVDRQTLTRIQLGGATADDVRRAEKAIAQRKAQLQAVQAAPQLQLQGGRPVVAGEQEEVGF